MTSHNHDGRGAVRGSRVRLSIPRWCGFWLSGPLLGFCVVIEGIYSTIAALYFVLTRKRQRARFRALLLGKDARLTVALMIATCALLFHGCASFPGASFGDQIDQFNWSVEALVQDDVTMDGVWESFHTMFVGDLGTEQLENTFSQLGW